MLPGLCGDAPAGADCPAAGGSVLPSPTARPRCRAGGGPGYLLQQGPQAQLVRAAALRPLAHVGRRHQPLAGAEVLRVHGPQDRAAGRPRAAHRRHRLLPPLPLNAGAALPAGPGRFPPERDEGWCYAGAADGAPGPLPSPSLPSRRLTRVSPAAGCRAEGGPLRGGLRPVQATGGLGLWAELWTAPC